LDSKEAHVLGSHADYFIKILAHLDYDFWNDACVASFYRYLHWL